MLIMECYLNRLLKLFKIVLGPYRIRSSCNHPAARITPLRRSSTMFPYNFDSPKVFSHRSVQISSGLSTDDRSMFVPGIVLFSFSEMKGWFLLKPRISSLCLSQYWSMTVSLKADQTKIPNFYKSPFIV